MMSFYNEDEHETTSLVPFTGWKKRLLQQQGQGELMKKGILIPIPTLTTLHRRLIQPWKAPNIIMGSEGKVDDLEKDIIQEIIYSGGIIKLGVYKDEAYVEEWWDRLTNLVSLYIQSKCGLEGQRWQIKHEYYPQGKGSNRDTVLRGTVRPQRNHF